MTGASSSYQAGGFRISQALVAENESVMIARLLTTPDASAVSDLILTDLVDSSQLSTLGQAVTTYDSKSGVLSSSVDGAYMGYAFDLAPNGFEVGTTTAVTGEVASDKLSMHEGPSSAAAAAVSWDFGGGSKVGAVELLSQLTVSSNPSSLKTNISSSTASVKVGTEDTLPAEATAATQAETFWNANLPLSNVSISRAGLSLPFSPTGAQPVASQLSLSGTVRYIVPSNMSQGWIPETAPVGNATAVATTSFYSVQAPGFVDSVRVIAQDSKASGDAQLLSPTLSLPGSVSRSILLRYKATFAGGGDFSQQSLYAALDIGPANGGSFVQALLIPAIGSAQDDACSGLLVAKSATPAATAKVDGGLVADGSWRTLAVDLNSIAGAGPLSLRLRFCATTTQPFTGEAELDVATAGVSVDSQATNFLDASIPSGGSAVQLTFIPGASFEPPSLVFNGSISVPLAQVIPLNWDGRAGFSGTLGWPTVGNPSNASNITLFSQVSLLGAKIFTPFFSLKPLVLVNGTNVQASSTGEAIDLSPGQLAAPGSSPQAFTVTLSFPEYYLRVTVLDADGIAVSGASMTVNGLGTQGKNATATTNPDGLATVPLMNGTYSLNVGFGGAPVGTATVQLDSNQSLKIPTSVNLTTLRVKDILGSPIQGATVGLEYNSAKSNVTTDSKGLASFPAVANAVYNVTVSVGGEPYYSGAITTSIYGAVIQVPTSFLSASMKIAIVSGLVLTLAIVASGAFLFRRRQAARIT